MLSYIEDTVDRKIWNKNKEQQKPLLEPASPSLAALYFLAAKVVKLFNKDKKKVKKLNLFFH